MSEDSKEQADTNNALIDLLSAIVWRNTALIWNGEKKGVVIY